jgi:hypothetical protein
LPSTSSAGKNLLSLINCCLLDECCCPLSAHELCPRCRCLLSIHDFPSTTNCEICGGI